MAENGPGFVPQTRRHIFLNRSCWNQSAGTSWLWRVRWLRPASSILSKRCWKWWGARHAAAGLHRRGRGGRWCLLASMLLLDGPKGRRGGHARTARCPVPTHCQPKISPRMCRCGQVSPFALRWWPWVLPSRVRADTYEPTSGHRRCWRGDMPQVRTFVRIPSTSFLLSFF
jgi:hypothetical protein